MSALLERDLAGAEVSDAGADTFDPGAYFDRWLAAVKAAQNLSSLGLPAADSDRDQEIYVESRIGSNCELNFDGVLHFDGYSLGNVVSPGGTLVLTRRGRIEADINVGTAIIDGFVTGNITASERVLLESDARVIGQIFTPALSMRLGAVLDGDCLFVTPEPSENLAFPNARAKQEADPVANDDLSIAGEHEAVEELEEFLLSA